MIDVGALDEFADGELRVVLAGGREVGVVRWGDEVFAVGNRCPHQGGPLCVGDLGPKLVSPLGTPGMIELDTREPVLSCPWHHWEFALRTGESVWDRSYRVKTYPARVEGRRVVLDVPVRRARSEAE